MKGHTRPGLWALIGVVSAIALWFVDAPGFALALGSLGIGTSALNAITEREGLPG